MTDEAVYRTAPATPGLLIMAHHDHPIPVSLKIRRTLTFVCYFLLFVVQSVAIHVYQQNLNNGFRLFYIIITLFIIKMAAYKFLLLVKVVLLSKIL